MATNVRTNMAGIRQLFSESGEVGRYMMRLGRNLTDAARRRVPEDTGKLARSFEKPVHQFRGNDVIVTVSNNAPYALFVHEGTRPHFPPSGALAGWAGRHGFPKASGGFLVARSISETGTDAQPFLRDALGYI